MLFGGFKHLERICSAEVLEGEQLGGWVLNLSTKMLCSKYSYALISEFYTLWFWFYGESRVEINIIIENEKLLF